MMKRTLIISLIVFPSICFGQISGFEFSRTNLIEFKKIVSHQINYHDLLDSSITQTIYHINDFGDIIKTESFTNGKLDHYGTREFDEQGRIISLQSYSEIYTYDENIGGQVPVWRDGYYNGSDFIYKEGRLIEERLYNCVEGIRSYNYVYRYYYDLGGRKIKTEHINFYIGITGNFKPDSSKLDSIYNKDQITIIITNYQYQNDTIIATNFGEDNEVEGYNYTILNNSNLPELIRSTDSSGANITIHKYKYNSSSNLIERSREIIDESKINYDMVVEDKYIVKYRKDGLPTTGLSYWQGKLISKRTLKYE